MFQGMTPFMDTLSAVMENIMCHALIATIQHLTILMVMLIHILLLLIKTVQGVIHKDTGLS
jgi:hypothetical protein